MYLAKRVRPEILLAVTFLAGRVLSPTQEDWYKLMRVLNYLNGSADLGMRLSATDGMPIRAYLDAAYGVHPDGRSHSGMVTRLGEAAVAVKACKQKINVKSSTEAELVSVTDGMSSSLYVEHFLQEQGYKPRPVLLQQDNQSTIKMIERGYPTQERSKHIHIRYFFLKDYIDRGEVRVEYRPTREMIADMLTKPLQGKLFIDLRAQLLNIPVV